MTPVVEHPKELLLHGATLYRIDVSCDGVIYGGYHSGDLGVAVTDNRLLRHIIVFLYHDHHNFFCQDFKGMKTLLENFLSYGWGG